MMPSIEVKSNEVECGNEMQSVINHFIGRIDDTMNDDNSLALKNPSEIKSEKENSNDNSLSSCLKCQNLQKKLKISRGWNRFFKEKLLNYDKLLHIIEKYENEKKKNIELQLAYDQRSREWSHQQEQLIALLHEVQPLREKLIIAEKNCEEEKKVRLKHQYMEDGFKVTIQQLQAKVSQMNTIANPIFVENLNKKLKDARSEIKKIKCNLEFKTIEVENLRSYISNKHVQIENLSKKLLWSLQLAIKFGSEEYSNREDTLEWKILQKQTRNILKALKAQFDTFRDTKERELEGRKLEIACLPSFSKWILDFDSCSMAKKESLEDFHHEATKCEEPNLIEEEGNQLEKLLSGVDVQEVFVNVNREDLNSSLELSSPVSKSPPKLNSKKSQLNIKNELEDCTKNSKIEKLLKNPKTPQWTNSNKASSEKSKSPLSNKANIKVEDSDNLNSNKSTQPSRRKRVNRISSVKNNAVASTSSFGDLSSTSAINKNSKFTQRRRLSSSSDMDENRSPVRNSVRTASKSPIADISIANSKSPRRRRLSSMNENQSPVRNSIFNDNKSALSAINSTDLKFKHKRWSSISDMDDDLSPVKSSTFNVNKSVLSAIKNTNSKSPRSKLSSKSDIIKNKSPVRNFKSPCKRRLSRKSENEDNRISLSNAEPSGNDNFNMFKILMNKSLEIPGKRLSSTPVKKLPNIELAKTPTSLMKRSRKIVTENLKNLSDTSSDSDSDNIPLSRLKKRHKKTFIDLKREKTNNLSNSDVISSMEVVMETPRTSSSSNNNKANKQKDLERIKQIMNEFTVPPLNFYSPYPEETDSSSNEIVQMLPKKSILIQKENLKKKISLPPVGGVNDFVPQRVTRSSYKRKSLPNESKKSSAEKEPKNEKHISPPKRKRRKSVLSTDTGINSRESSVIFPLSLTRNKEEYSKVQTSETSMVTKDNNQSTPIKVSKESILKCDIEISNHNTGLEEDEKHLAKDLTEEISNSKIDKNTDLEENEKELTNADLIEEIGDSGMDKNTGLEENEKELTNADLTENIGDSGIDKNTGLEENENELTNADLTEDIGDSGIDKNTGLKENEKKLTNAELTEEIGNSVIDKCSIIKSLDKPTSLSTEDKSIFDENFMNTVELAYKMEDEESDKSIKQADNLSDQTVKEIFDSSSLGLNLSEDSFQEENEKKLTSAELTEEIGNSVIDKCSIIKSLDKPTSLSTEDKSIFDENFINTDMELACKMEDEESDKNIKQADNLSDQTVKEIFDSSSLGLNLSEDSFQEEDEEQETSNKKSVLSLSQICNDSLKLISPITSPIKNDPHLSTSNDTEILLNQDFGKNQTNVLPENFNIKTPLNITESLFSNEMSQSLQSVLEKEDIVLNKSQLKTEKISGDAIPNNASQMEHKNISHLSKMDGISNTPIIEVTGGKSFSPKMAVLVPAIDDIKIEDDDGLQVQTKDMMEVTKVENYIVKDNGEKYTSKKLPSKLNSLFTNELSSQGSLNSFTTTVSKRHPSSSSNLSMVLSDSSDSIGEDNANITVNFECMEAKLDLTSDEEENSLIMDIDMNLPQIDKRDSDDAGYSNNEYYHKALDVDTKITSAEVKDINKSSVLMKSTEDNYLNSSQTNESEINLAASSTAVLPSFYKERNESPEQNGFEVPDIFFSELPEDEEKETSQNEKSVKAKKKNKAKKTKKELAHTEVQIKTVKPKVKKVASKYSPICLPQIRNHHDFQTKPSKFPEKEGDSVLLHEYFKDIIGSHLGSQEWNILCDKICDHLKNTEAPSLISKLQPLTRILLISILRSSPYEKRDNNFSVPPTIYKLFQIVRIIEGHFEFPPFTLDSLVNVAAHKLILTRKLRANSLTSLSTWVICSCYSQYNKFEKPQDEECLRWGRGFLTDLLFHHSGLTHESLLTAINSSKKTFLRIVKYRESTVLEKIIFWITYYGSWNGPKATKKKLLDAVKLKLGLINPPPEQPMDLLKTILLVLINAEVDDDDDELASTKTGFLLLLSWVPRSWIIKNIFPLLKDVYYDDFIKNKLPLDDLKELLAFMVKRVHWPEEEEKLFLNSLTSFPLLKS